MSNNNLAIMQNNGTVTTSQFLHVFIPRRIVVDVAYKPPPPLTTVEEVPLINLMSDGKKIREARLYHLRQYDTYALICVAESFDICKEFINFVHVSRNGSAFGTAQVQALPGFVEKILGKSLDGESKVPKHLPLSHVWFVPPAWMFDPWSLEKRYRSSGSDTVLKALLFQPPAWQIRL